ncbi:MAG: molecular chaperone HtpG [Deltaproteobacteria bacterium]|nr:molecular chaperone HtpG [Deltaproteobacteria bacterium]
MTTETRQFKTEVNKLLELMIHSLYSHKEIFLRELISNASDALDKGRYEALTDEALHEGEGEGKIQLIPDKEAGTLTVRDNGIGMTREEIVEALGTIAHSGTKEFLKLLESRQAKDNPELIGQFGVGFYSSFMVADEVTVLSRRAGSDPGAAVRWQSTADGTFTVEDAVKDTKGTDVILTLKQDERAYLDEWELRNIVKKYSDFIEYPVAMAVTRTQPGTDGDKKGIEVTTEETLNSRKALWLKPKAEVTEEEYREFYRHVSHDFGDFAKVIHYRAEGTTEFSSLLYVPKTAPWNLFYKDFKVGPMLYVRRVQITDHCEDLLPPYLRFIKGVVESSDLPLNVSREILQNNKMVEVIRKSATKKVLDALAEMKTDDPDAYGEFYRQFGRVLKEGLHFDFERREQIADLLLFASTATEEGKTTTLADYVGRMPEAQKEIYYLTGASLAEAAASPYLEAFRDMGYEVLLMTDEIDDLLVSNLGQYREKPFQSVLKGDLDLGGEKRSEQKEAYGKLLDLIKDRLGNEVAEVRVSGRLKDSAVCLVRAEGDMDPQMEKMLKALGQEVPARKRALEINPDHALLKAMSARFERNRDDPLLGEYSQLLFDQALLLEGGRPKDPVAFAKAVARLMAERASEGIAVD